MKCLIGCDRAAKWVRGRGWISPRTLVRLCDTKQHQPIGVTCVCLVRDRDREGHGDGDSHGHSEECG